MEQLIFLILPLSVTALILFVAMFSHLKFDLVSLKTVQMGSAIAGGLFGFLYFTNMYNLLVNYSVFISEIHYVNLGLFLSYVIILGLFSRRIIPNVIQIFGLGVLGTSLFLLLA